MFRSQYLYMKISISIVLYNPDIDLLIEVLRSLEAASLIAKEKYSASFEVDLVNNNAADSRIDKSKLFLGTVGSAAVLDIHLLQAGANVGYGAGNNISIKRHADSDFHLVLNPDVLLHDRAMVNAIDFMLDNAEVGLLSPQVRGLDGELHYLCKRNPTLFDMFFRGFFSASLRNIFSGRDFWCEMRAFDYSGIIRPVCYPTGCFMFFRTPVLHAINGFDEDYFLHYEDADIGRRVMEVSETVYVPSVKIQHKWTRGSHGSWSMRWITIKSGLLYWKKWGGIF